MAYNSPTITDFKVYFARDFVFGSTDQTVMDSDIVKAEAEALVYSTQTLFNDQNSYTVGMLYLEAHLMVLNLQASSQGTNGTYPWVTNSKTVGNVSESYSVPERILANPIYATFSKTYYGMKYLELVLPLLSGVMFNAWGRTNP